MLTKKQHELLVFINQRIEEDGISPSFDEMKEALALKSKSGIHRLITALEERGFIRRLAHRARALEVLKLPDSASPGGTPTRSSVIGFAPNVIPGNFPTRTIVEEPSSAREDAAEAVEIPLYGKIAAGTPIEALRDPNQTVAVPSGMIVGGDHYALEIDGDSMIEAGIFNGDTVLIKRCDNAETGAIVVALVDDQEATLKRLRKKGQSVALEPANIDHETQIYGADRVKIQGRLVGLLRQY